MNATIELVVTECWCGIPHAVPRTMYDHMQRQHRDGEKQKGIYCPLGHNWTFAGRGEAERLRDRLTTAERAVTRVRAEKDQVEASLRATKGALTKAKNRADKGVCQHCKRSFVNVARHVQSKHPEVVA